MFFNSLWPHNTIHITGNVLPGQAAGKVFPAMMNPALQCFGSHITLEEMWSYRVISAHALTPLLKQRCVLEFINPLMPNGNFFGPGSSAKRLKNEKKKWRIGDLKLHTWWCPSIPSIFLWDWNLLHQYVWSQEELQQHLQKLKTIQWYQKYRLKAVNIEKNKSWH